ncbi:MAG TPA: hypothetical protein VNA16_02050 [Abditibacteriaceae bacterium]|nr:hypothetical protein [Abditibacteriaceae bacterium]
MHRFSSLFSLTLVAAGVLLASGCAKGPAGGPVVPAPNRLTVTLTTQDVINNSGYIYAFAFDDDDDSSDGPGALVTSTVLPNGVVGGSFTVLVLYQGGTFQAFRRTVLVNGSEALERSTNAFVPFPSPATGRTISFTLNLDATTANTGTRLFRTDAQRLDINFVTTNERRLDPNNNLLKTYDAFGARLPNFWITRDIRGTITYTNNGTESLTTNDVVTDAPIGSVNLNQLNIVDFTIGVERS